MWQFPGQEMGILSLPCLPNLMVRINTSKTVRFSDTMEMGSATHQQPKYQHRSDHVPQSFIGGKLDPLRADGQPHKVGKG